jgi:16S rRNA (guanine966-N2)-methyltransferase
MRIVGGRFRGVPLAAPPAGDLAVRPTTDRVRESLFNLLVHRADGPSLEGARVLDLFAGTGALGLEALSRGAREATFVENAARSASLIASNVERLRVGEVARVVRRDATRIGPCPVDPHDVVFLDPPYGRGLGKRALAAALEGGWLAPGALVVWEENAPVVPPPGLTLLDARRYGDTMISLLRYER